MLLQTAKLQCKQAANPATHTLWSKERWNGELGRKSISVLKHAHVGSLGAEWRSLWELGEPRATHFRVPFYPFPLWRREEALRWATPRVPKVFPPEFMPIYHLTILQIKSLEDSPSSWLWLSWFPFVSAFKLPWHYFDGLHSGDEQTVPGNEISMCWPLCRVWGSQNRPECLSGHKAGIRLVAGSLLSF